MAKNNRDNNRSNLVWTPAGRDLLIDSMIGEAGVLPSRVTELETIVDGEVVSETKPAREKLNQLLDVALRELGWKPTSSTKKRIAQLRRIETAAKRLLIAVANDHAAVSSYYLGVKGAAQQESKGTTDKFLPLQLARLVSPSSRVELAIDGVEALERWARAAAEEAEHRDSRRKERPAARHTGDVGLNSYIEIIVRDCWCGVWGHKVRDSRKLRAFVGLATDAAGIPLSQAAIRERIRRLFKLRRVNQEGDGLDLPNIAMHRTARQRKTSELRTQHRAN